MYTVIWSRQGNHIRFKLFKYLREAKPFVSNLLKAKYLDVVLVKGYVVNNYMT